MPSPLWRPLSFVPLLFLLATIGLGQEPPPPGEKPKDLRKLRTILRDPVAKDHFLKDEGDIDSALLRVAHAETKSKRGLAGELGSAVQAMKRVPWTALEELRGNAELLKTIDDAEVLLKSLRKALSS